MTLPHFHSSATRAPVNRSCTSVHAGQKLAVATARPEISQRTRPIAQISDRSSDHAHRQTHRDHPRNLKIRAQLLDGRPRASLSLEAEEVGIVRCLGFVCHFRYLSSLSYQLPRREGGGNGLYTELAKEMSEMLFPVTQIDSPGFGFRRGRIPLDFATCRLTLVRRKPQHCIDPNTRSNESETSTATTLHRPRHSQQ